MSGEKCLGVCSGEIFREIIFDGECSRELSGAGDWIRMQDYKSLYVAVVICATLVNIQTHRQTDGSRLSILIA